MSTTVYSVIKSKPKRVKRKTSIEGLHEEPLGKVTTEKFIAFSDDIVHGGIFAKRRYENRRRDENDNMIVADRQTHTWSLLTNLSSAQICVHCDKRIQMKRVAYKCTACKCVSHLRCRHQNLEAVCPLKVHARETDLCQENHTTRSGKPFGLKNVNVKAGRPLASIENISQPGKRNDTVAPPGEQTGSDEVDGDFPVEMADCSTQTLNLADISTGSKHSQVKQKLSQMKTGIVKKYKDLRNRCTSRKGHGSDTYDVQDVENEKPVEDDTEVKEAAHSPSPVKTSRFPTEQPSPYRDTQNGEVKERKNLFKSGVKRRRALYPCERVIEDIRERLDDIELKVRRLECTIPDQVKQWTTLQRKHQEDDISLCSELETEVKAPRNPVVMSLNDDMPLSSLDDDVMVTASNQESTSSGQLTNGGAHLIHDSGLSAREDSLLTHHSTGKNGKLRLDIGHAQSLAAAEHQTSTPVTNHELSFRSASKKYELSQVRLANYASITVENGSHTFNQNMEDGETDCPSSVPPETEVCLTNFTEIVMEQGEFVEKDHKDLPDDCENDFVRDKSGRLSSEHEVVKDELRSFIEYRRRSLNRSSEGCKPKSSNWFSANSSSNSGGINGVTSPVGSPGLSSTFRNGNALNSETSPISFTFRNDQNNFDMSQGQFTKVETAKLECQGDSNEDSKMMSHLSFTFRNDSSLMHMDENEGDVSSEDLNHNNAAMATKSQPEVAMTTSVSMTTCAVSFAADSRCQGSTQNMDGASSTLTYVTQLDSFSSDFKTKMEKSNKKYSSGENQTGSVTPLPPSGCGKQNVCQSTQSKSKESSTEVKAVDQRTDYDRISLNSETQTDFCQHDNGTQTSVAKQQNDAKYHFLHEKGMVKICSPKVKLVKESPDKIVESLENIVENGETSESQSDMDSGTEINTAGIEKMSQKTDITGSSARVCCEHDGTFEEAENKVLDQFLGIADEGMQNFDAVANWVNRHGDQQGCDDDMKELLPKSQTMREKSASSEDDDSFKQHEKECDAHNESVYYSFNGKESWENQIDAKGDNGAKGHYFDCMEVSAEEESDLLSAFRENNFERFQNILKLCTQINESDIEHVLALCLQRRKKNFSKAVLDFVCEQIKVKEGDSAVEVWPAFRELSPWKPVFVVLVNDFCQGETETFWGLEVYRRRFDFVSPEGAMVMSSDLMKDNPLSTEDFEKVKVAMATYNINKKHSNVNIITACPVRSKNGGEDLTIETCIAVHCLVKGLIPFGEDPFPKQINGIPIDVREGYCNLGIFTPPERRRVNTASRTKAWDFSDDASSQSSVSNSQSGNSLPSSSQSDHSVASLAASNSASSLAASSGSNLDVDIDMEMDVRNRNRTLRPRRNIHARFNDLSLDDADCDHDDDTVMVETNPAPQDSANNLIPQGDKSDQRNRSLLIGTGIGGETGRGTLTGFVFLPEGGVGCLTAAHLVKHQDVKISQPADSDIPRHLQGKNICGEVVRIKFRPGSLDETGVDAAIVKITDRFPAEGKFVWVRDEQLSFAGFDPRNPPNFSSGKILTTEELTPKKRHTNVLKFGSETGLTCGRLHVGGLYVKFVNREMELPSEGRKIEFFNQLEILSISGSTRFFDLGDSGAAVFMPLNGSELYCIGMAIGCTSYHSCLVTPVKTVLEALKLPSGFIDFNVLHRH